MKRTISLTLAVVLTATPALAHPDHVASGFLHPLGGLDHLLAMVAVGIWASFLGVERRSASVLVPAAFLIMMAIGAAAGFAGIKLPMVEAAILTSVFVLGALVALAVRLPSGWAMGLVGGFALFHGYAHASEAPAGSPGTYALSFLAATTLLLVVGSGLSAVVRCLIGDLGVRALGGLAIAGGAFVLVGT